MGAFFFRVDDEERVTEDNLPGAFCGAAVGYGREQENARSEFILTLEYA